MPLATDKWKSAVWEKALKPLLEGVSLVIAAIFCEALFLALGIILLVLYLLFFVSFLLSLGHINLVENLNILIEGDMGKALLALALWPLMGGHNDSSQES